MNNTELGECHQSHMLRRGKCLKKFSTLNFRVVAVVRSQEQRLQAKAIGWPGITSKAVEDKRHPLTISTAKLITN